MVGVPQICQTEVVPGFLFGFFSTPQLTKFGVRDELGLQGGGGTPTGPTAVVPFRGPILKRTHSTEQEEEAVSFWKSRQPGSSLPFLSHI